VITSLADGHDSPRYLSGYERISLAACIGRAHDACIAALMSRSASTVSPNGMQRVCLPKGTDLSVHTSDDVALVEPRMHERLRTILGWDSPAERLATLLGPPSVLRR
jgi:hypothetical protein